MQRPQPGSSSWGTLNTLYPESGDSSSNDISVRRSWGAFAIAAQGTIRKLLDVYFEIVYPIFPLFHRPSFEEKLNQNYHLQDTGLFASIMAACALASARVRDGALFSVQSTDLSQPPPEMFFNAAKDLIPKDLGNAKGTSFMRACALLAITSIQNGQIKSMQQYLGYYHTLMAMDGRHDEKLWPKELTPIEKEERRRLFWSIYTLDIYSSIVWGGIIRHREAQCLVRYPTELDDEHITATGYDVSNNSAVNWLQGWNFTTDLYRVLEHAVDEVRGRCSLRTGTVQFLSGRSSTSLTEAAIMKDVLDTYLSLPQQFHECREITGDASQDLFGFQSANIQATLQLLRTVLLSAEDNVSVSRKCDVAGELLRVFSIVPVEYLRAISSPLLHHLAGIGNILGSVIEGTLSESSYQRIRTLLLELADLLRRLESRLYRAAGASERLRMQVDKIDEYMRNQGAHERQVRQNTHNILIRSNIDGPQGPTSLNISNVSQDALFGTDPDNVELSPFQLPPELLIDWPWPFDFGGADSLFTIPTEE
ncbi:hypothetical protein ZTR_01531 [Talaromyces verruculosus]|nr:hypothetical protein ZTR_01531 [Talaromyces verruculosus]